VFFTLQEEKIPLQNLGTLFITNSLNKTKVDLFLGKIDNLIGEILISTING